MFFLCVCHFGFEDLASLSLPLVGFFFGGGEGRGEFDSWPKSREGLRAPPWSPPQKPRGDEKGESPSSHPSPHPGPQSQTYPLSHSGATPSAPNPLLGRGRKGEWAHGRGACGRCPGSLQEGAARGMQLPFLSARSVPPRLGLAPRALLGAPGPGPGPARPQSNRAPAPLPATWGPGLWVGAGRGSLCPTHASPLPQSSRFQGPRRRPLPGPVGPPPPGRAAPPGSRGRGLLPFSTITPTDSCPHPSGTSANGGSPGPGPTCTAQPSLEVGAGNLPPSYVSHWPFRGTSGAPLAGGGCPSERWGGTEAERDAGASASLSLGISLSLSRLLEMRDIWMRGLERGLRWKEQK